MHKNLSWIDKFLIDVKEIVPVMFRLETPLSHVGKIFLQKCSNFSGLRLMRDVEAV
jgi:hypothetical protein